MRLSWDGSGTTTAEAWGPGADWLLDRAPRWVGLLDDLTGFDPTLHPTIDEWWRRRPGLRLTAAGVIWQELLLVLLGQRVTTEEAVKSWARMAYAWGEPAPGPCELQLPPRPEVVAAHSYVDFHRMNVERRRADVILSAARRADRLEDAATMGVDDAIARLTALPGMGAWTATSVVNASLGDPDTIVLRDYGLPTMVNYAFTGDARRLPADEGGDEVMCAHLAPWGGHRYRIVRLLFAAGVSVPRRGPRAANPDIRRL
jgi:3-methyladenine DNA glycosylase/8-oxoguanine DNA glycosylase